MANGLVGADRNSDRQRAGRQCAENLRNGDVEVAKTGRRFRAAIVLLRLLKLAELTGRQVIKAVRQRDVLRHQQQGHQQHLQ